MKLKRLNEDVMFPETACTSEIREQVYNAVVEILNENFDNLAFIISEKVKGYNPDWCNTEADISGEYNQSIAVCAQAVCNQLFYNCSSLNEEADKDTLNEGPIANLYRKAANFVDRDASRVRERNKKAAGAADAKAQRDAQKVLARDVAPEYKDCRFYFNGKGKPISWDDWKDKYADLSPDDPNYEGMYNAIVTKPNGQIIRRGVEYLEKKGIYLKPGVTDRIPDMYKYRKPVDEIPEDDTEDESSDSSPETTEKPGDTENIDSKKGQKVNLDDYVEYNGKKISVNKLIHIAKKTKYLESVEDELVEGYDFIYGQEVLSGMIDNASEDEIDSDVKKLRKIARILKTNVDDLVCYVDPELVNDPIYLDDANLSTQGNLAICTVDGINVVSEMINGNLWLYFDSEDAGNQYLDYVQKTFE